MTCSRSGDDWHSYTKKNLADTVLLDMAAHLTHCPECRHTVDLIRETDDLLSKGRVAFSPPLDLKINIMASIDKNKYKARKNSFPTFDLKNWGLSMVAAGFLLFALNLSSLAVNFKGAQVAELNNEITKQIVVPFDKMSELTHGVLMKISSLSTYQAKSTR